MKDSGDVLEIEDDHGTTHTKKKWSESDLDTCTISWTSFREKDGNCQTACALSSSLIRSWPAIVMRIQGRQTNEACADGLVLPFGCSGNGENQHC